MDSLFCVRDGATGFCRGSAYAGGRDPETPVPPQDRI